MKKYLKVSVIIACYNEEKYIARCLNDLLGQDYPEFELLVVDDGSVDSSVEIVKSFPVILIKQKHSGLALSRNNGAKHAKGKILVFLDADMEFPENFLRNLTDPINRHKSKGTFSKEEYVANWDQVWARCWNYNNNWPLKRMIPEDYPDVGSDFRAILKSEFDKVKGFDNTGYNDSWSLPTKLGYQPTNANGAVYYHANPDSLSEIFYHAKWVGKRDYRYGVLGKLLVLAKSTFPFSLIMGIYKAIKFQEAHFIIFKVIYDLGILLGLLEMMLYKKTSK
ncbi:glycosyltransferase family 2 protein [Patescibacteria group bacterium]|nr:glycosyltransferase family 2 protein [Patescibacteria group bacterium]